MRSTIRKSERIRIVRCLTDSSFQLREPHHRLGEEMENDDHLPASLQDLQRLDAARLGVETSSLMAARRTSWLLAALIAVGTALAVPSVPLPRACCPAAEVCAIALLSESDCETEAPSERSDLTPEFEPSTDCLRYEPRASSRRFWSPNYRRPPPFSSPA